VTELRERVAGLGLDGVEVAEAPPVVIEADQQRLAQSLLNLVVNATTHTPDGTTVRVGAAVDGEWLRVTVADDGPGIDPSVRDRVFEPFVTTRSDGSGRGRGLGLAVVRTLTEAQGGRVDLTSSACGTTFDVYLRLAS
jgi:two-component system OmpR family sensor kinase